VSCTIVAGSLAERTYLDSYIIFALLMSSIIQPVCAAWTKGDGWLARLGYRDAGGSGFIHLIGGVCGLVGTTLQGPRHGVLNQENKAARAQTLKKKIIKNGKEVT